MTSRDSDDAFPFQSTHTMQHNLIHRSTRVALAAALLLAGGLAQAASCTGISLGTSSTDDVKLGGINSTQCVVSSVNAQGGPNGNTSAFSSSFGSGWSLLGKVDGNGAVGSLNSLSGVNFGIGFSKIDGDTGTWTLTASKAVTMDLVFAMHAGGRTGSFLFDDIALTTANAATPGTWEINWTNKGGQTPDYSNLTVFGRDVTVSPVPEPQTYAMLLAGLGVVVLVSRRKQR